MCPGVNIKCPTASHTLKSDCTNHPKIISPETLLPAIKMESSNLHRTVSSFLFLLTAWLPVACNYFGMPVLMMCPVHLACSSVSLVICCFFVSCLPKGHYIISKTKRNSSIIYQAGFTAHLSLISRPCSILHLKPTCTLQPTLVAWSTYWHKEFIKQKSWDVKMKLVVLQTGIWYHFKHPVFLNLRPLVPLLLCLLLTEKLFVSKSMRWKTCLLLFGVSCGLL